MEPVIETKPPKKPRSEAQKKATENALNILKARREAKKENEIREEKPAVHSTPAPASGDYVSKKDFESFMQTVNSTLTGLKAPPAVSQPKAKKRAEVLVEEEASSSEEEYVKKPSKRAVQPPVQRLSGFELLDELLFKR